MFKRIIVGVALALACPAIAADNKTAKDASAATFTLRFEDRSSIFFPVHMCVTLADETVDCGTPIVNVLNTLDTRVDGLETAVTSTNTKLDTLITDIGTLRTAIGTSATASDCDGSAPLMGYSLCSAIKLTAMEGDTSPVPVIGYPKTVDGTTTRPGDAAPYAINDAFANSTSAPTSGGFTLSNMCRGANGSGTMKQLNLIYSTASSVTGEIWFFDSAVTALNDNAAFSVSDSDQLKWVGTVSFSTTAQALNATYQASGVNISYTCVGTADLRYLIKITGAYTPASGDVFAIRAMTDQTN